MQEKDKNLALMTHLSGFGSHFFPLGSIIIPFIIRETKKNDSAFMNQLTKDVVNFNVSYLLYTFILKLLVVPLFISDLFTDVFTNYDNLQFNYNFDSDDILGLISLGSVLSILAIVKFVFIVKAAIKTHNGETYHYPYVIQFIK